MDVSSDGVGSHHRRADAVEPEYVEYQNQERCHQQWHDEQLPHVTSRQVVAATLILPPEVVCHVAVGTSRYGIT